MSHLKKDIYGPDPVLIEIDELKTWIVHEDDDLLVIDKPGWVVCHPSKNGPRSSLVGACREYLEVETIHLVSRLDRETSGIVILAKNKPTARRWQMAFQDRKVDKTYTVILEGELGEETTVNRRLAKDIESPVYIKQVVRRSNSSKSATTLFNPLLARHGFTICRVTLLTGRKHQIRAHAEWLEHRIVGDKIYGPDATLYLEFIEHGWTDRMVELLPMQRQAIHASKVGLAINDNPGGDVNSLETFTAPIPEDMISFCQKHMKINRNELSGMDVVC